MSWYRTTAYTQKQDARRGDAVRLLKNVLMAGGIGFVTSAAFPMPMAVGAEILPADIAALVHVEDPQISPDGRNVLYEKLSPPAPMAPAKSRLWVVPTQGGGADRPLPGSEEGDHAARWAPDGTALAFIGQRGHADAQHVMLARPWTAPAHAVGELKGSPLSLRWSPDGRFLAVITTEKAVPEPRGVVMEGAKGATHLLIVDVQTGGSREVPMDGKLVFDVDWSPAGDRLVLRTGEEGGLDYYWYRSRIEVVTLDGHQVALLPHRATAVHPSFSPDGQSVLYGFFSEHGITGNVVRFDLKNHAETLVGKDWDGSLRYLEWDRDGHGLTALGLEGLSSCLVHVSLDDGKISVRSRVLGEQFSFSRSRDGSAIALEASTREHPDEAWLYQNGQGHPLTDNNPQVAGWPLGDQRPVHWTGRDGTRLEGLLILPPGWKAGQKLPLFVQVHGGPLEAWSDGWLGSWHNWARLVASHGIAVFLPNPRGSEGQGDAFAEASRHDWGGGDYQDILSGVDSLVHDGIADPAHMALGGWSYGGFMAAWAAGHNDRFRTFVSGAGISDLLSMAVATDVGYSFIPAYFGDPLTHREEYAAHSPISFAKDIHTPMLLLHGDGDARVPTGQSRMLYAALHEAGKPVTFVHYPDAPHWFGGSVGSDYEVDVQERVLSWLLKYM
ncbi:S9 family peptidase [Novacetimonas pomaceti]|uniref:S9 family peptidase n=1 Tax=Novacetimonas pomaceti TaxID=2021998 RepID=UPI001C2D1AA7|nr:S9 family peptidase [Novacetimonas pomaceti]MBV1834358.1 S9 family peptidase [Novacetimonas pomaceti]